MWHRSHLAYSAHPDSRLTAGITRNCALSGAVLTFSHKWEWPLNPECSGHLRLWAGKCCGPGGKSLFLRTFSVSDLGGLMLLSSAREPLRSVWRPTGRSCRGAPRRSGALSQRSHDASQLHYEPGWASNAPPWLLLAGDKLFLRAPPSLCRTMNLAVVIATSPARHRRRDWRAP